MKHKKFGTERRRFNFKKGLVVAMLIGLAIVGAQSYADHASKAAGWTLSNIQGNNITSANNPGGYPNNTPSQSPDNSTNFSPAFGNNNTSLITINGSGFPTPDFDIDAKEVRGGDGFACYLSNAPDSWLYCWGDNSSGQLGDGTATTRATPVPIVRGQMSDGEKIASFSTGYHRACVVTDASKAYCWGNNGNGELGTSGPSNYVTTPSLVAQGELPSGAYFKTISAGQTHTCAVSSADAVYCWGYGLSGKLGQGDTRSHYVPKKVKTVSDGSSYTMPDAVKHLSAGSDSTCAVASDDMVYCWGSNAFGQVGNNKTTNQFAPTSIYGLDGTVFRQVEQSIGSTCALTDAGKVYCWGRNNYGQLGNGTTNNSSVAIAVSGSTEFSKIGSSDPRNSYGFCAISKADLGYCWGSKAGNQPTQIKTASNGGTMPDKISSIARFGHNTADASSCMVADDSKVYCAGNHNSTHPVLANNTYFSTSVPAEIIQFNSVPKIQFDDIYGPECHSTIILSDTQLRCMVTNVSAGASSSLALGQGLHDVLVTYGGETKTLPQSYMYKTIPQQPTNFTAVGKNKSVHLEWDWPGDKPYFTSVVYYVECKRSDKTVFVNPTSYGCDSGQFGGSSSAKVSQTTADIVGLQNGVAYDFLVRTDSGVDSNYGAFQRGVVPQASSYVPTPPTIASVTSGAASVTLTWSPPTSNGGSPITNYGLLVQQHGATGYGMSKLYLGDVTSSGTVNLSFSTAGPAKISVVALNANGASEPSQVVEVWGASAKKPPGQPADVKINNVSANQTKLSWLTPSSNGSAITKYEARYSTKHDFADWVGTAGTDTCVSSTPSPPATTCTTAALTLGTQYYFQVRASNDNGAGEWSAIHASVVGAPDRPVISTTTPSDAAVYVAWDAPNDNGAAITKYKLQYDTDPNFTNATTVDTGTTANHTLKPAVNGTIYYFRVQAVNSRGDSPWSDSVSAIPYAPPSKLSIKPNQGLIVGGDLTTISGDNLSGVTSVKIDGNECKSFTVVDVHTVNCLTPAGAVGPKDVAVTNPGGTATIVGGFTYGLPSISLDIDHDIDLEVDNPSAASTVSSSHTVNVKTDNPSGYQLSLSMSGSDQNLASSTATISPTNASSTATALPLGTWGHSVIDAKNHWTSVPASAQPKLIKKTTTSSINGMSGTGDNTPVFYGVNVGLAQRAGVYTGKVVYTVVAEY